MTTILAFDTVARLPAETDNIAIATRRLEAGTRIAYGHTVLSIEHTILLGHRFAVQPIMEGEALRSWGQTFGIAIQPIPPGAYICNQDVLNELRRRSLNIDLPTIPNFRNDLETYTFDAANFQPAPPIPRHPNDLTFLGYQRGSNRGVGTRNMIVLLGVTSLVSGFIRQLETRLKNHNLHYHQVDSIVGAAHTEGAHGHANNQELLLRTLAGFIVHPNVGAVLVIDDGHSAINNRLLDAYLTAHHYPIDHVLHGFMSLSASFNDDLATAELLVASWLPLVDQMPRTPQPLSALKIALQCGGSDAFSGISGNPLAAWVTKEVIQYGGSANLAETDELIGAETYVLAKVRDQATALKFLGMIDRFKERVGWHGHSAEGNPSGGNKFRGLYNIYLKSLGAATKRHPDVPLDYAIEYGEPMTEPGYYFMDSPGNDLESIAGQIASGCNLIFFVTGNGSITNFPFVPTIKIVTTTERYQLLKKDMDINAGAYLDGTPLEVLGAETFAYTLDIASGQLSIGEQAGHAQVQIWRDWQQTQSVDLEPLRQRIANSQPLLTSAHIAVDVPHVAIPVYQEDGYTTTERVGLILPTSLCSGQIARLCAEHLNKHQSMIKGKISRFVTLVHTEGCGGSVTDEFRETLLGYLGHPFVAEALLLEHGCESTHNDYFRQAMQARGYDPEDYGWASIQLDGGIQSVVRKMAGWFAQQFAADAAPVLHEAGLEAVHLALVTYSDISADTTQIFAQLTRMIVKAGGTVIIHEQDPLWRSEYRQHLGLGDSITPSLNYAQNVTQTGFHLMAMPTRDWGEILTGLGATGVNLILSFVGAYPMPGHPMIPVLQVSAKPHPEIDLVLDSVDTLLDGIVETLAHRYTPKVVASGNVYFQVTRGLLGVSL